MTTTPNMGLTLPVPSTTAGPLYAQQEVTAFTTIDAHDHSSGKGVLIGVAGINILADLPFNSNNLNTVRGLRLVSLGSLPTLPLDLRMVYSYNSELYYQDAAGNNVQLTNAGSVAGATGTIAGLASPATASYAGGRFTFNKDSSKPGKLSISDINLYEFNNAAANAITIKSPASLAAAYSLTLLTALPVSTSLLQVDSSGNVTASLNVTNAVTLSGGATISEPATITGSHASGNGTQLSILNTSTGQNLLIQGGTGNNSPFINVVSNDDLYFLTNNAAAMVVKASGNVLMLNSLQITSSGPVFKTKQFTGTLSASAGINLTISGTIIGAIGMSSYSGLGTGDVFPMSLTIGTPLAVGCYFSLNTAGSVRVNNGDSGNTNSYNVTIFYT